MNEDLLWYAARVSGLMTWVLAYGSLICSLLVRSQPDEVSSPSRLWAEDACRFFGFTSVLFAAVHGASIVTSSMFDVAPESLVTLRGGQALLETGLLVGVLSAWALVVANGLRFLERRFARVAPLARTVLMVAVLIGGAYHGWSVGSDVRNYATYAVIAVATAMSLVAVGLAFAGNDRHTDGAESAMVTSPVSAVASPRTTSLTDGARGISSSEPSPSVPEWTGAEVTTVDTAEPEINGAQTSSFPAGQVGVDPAYSAPRPPVALPELKLSRPVDDPADRQPLELAIPEIESARLVVNSEHDDDLQDPNVK